jgi:hypothetical protein
MLFKSKRKKREAIHLDSCEVKLAILILAV